jgi:CPA2 family monovalent cation:H+ antiporter-2
LNRVLRRIREMREHRYSLFRGFFRGISDEHGDADQKMQPRLHSVMIVPGAAAIGKSLGELDLARIRVEVTAVRRRNVRTTTPAADTRIEENDVVVLLGAEEDVAAAEMKLVQG